MNTSFEGMTPEQAKAVRNHLYHYHKTLSHKQLKLLEVINGLTMCPPVRIIDAHNSATQAAARYPKASIVEFGVYRGGVLASMGIGAMAAPNFEGSLIGFDTFEGHTIPPLPDERDIHGTLQLPIFNAKHTVNESWAACDKETVERNIDQIQDSMANEFSSPKFKPVLIEGDARVSANYLKTSCVAISCLRLDMDWEEPTAAALHIAEPLFTPIATIIADDYGHHSGVKKVIDDFLSRNRQCTDYSFIDYSCIRINIFRA
jgi:O-methyltransferase